MKKIITLLLALVICLSLTACGKSDAVKNVEAMIDALGEITLESIDAICSAEDAYNALTEDEQKKVDNYATLTQARDSYYELALVGNWYSPEINLFDVEANYKKSGLSLNSDLSCSNCEYENASSGAWSVTDSILQTRFDEAGEFFYTINDVDGKISLQLKHSDTGRTMMNEEDYFAYLDDIFLIADLSAENVADYCELYYSEPRSYVDVWGETVETEYYSASLRAKSKAYNDGWIYIDCTSDLVIEVLHPEYTRKRTGHGDSYTQSVTYPAGSIVSTEPDPFTCYFPLELHGNNEYDTSTTDLSLDKLSFGRAKGKIFYINAKYVTEVVCNHIETTRYLMTDFGQSVTNYWNQHLGDY